jgi:ABC-type Zn2+ transport system substrate-binding protein/surface adhesin
MSIRDGGTVPYVSPSDTRHIPTTTTHTHDHAAHGHPDHDDGIHSHTHSHQGDADHDHEHVHLHAPGKDSGSGAQVTGAYGTYGALMETASPVQRAQLRAQMLRDHESRR